MWGIESKYIIIFSLIKALNKKIENCRRAIRVKNDLAKPFLKKQKTVKKIRAVYKKIEATNGKFWNFWTQNRSTTTTKQNAVKKNKTP